MKRRALGFLMVVLACATLEARTVIVEFRGAPEHQRLRRDLAESRIATNAGAMKPRIRHEYSTVFSGAAVEASEDVIARLRTLPYVRAIHADGTVRAFIVEDRRSRLSGQAGLPVLYNARARVKAGDLPTRGEGIVIAIVDTGIDYTHPALGGGFGPGHRVAGGYDFHNGDADPMDDNGHGTHVAGIAAADSPSLIGVAPAATLVAYKVLSGEGSGSFSSVLAAIERCADPNGDGNTDDHVDVANLSLGGLGHPDDLLSRAVDNATAKGVVFAIAAGNTGGFRTIASPGAARTAITVGAEFFDGGTAGFSAGGPTFKSFVFKPDVIAPGWQIPSAWLGGATIQASGTSMAAPHVAGVAALLRKLHPDWTPAMVKAAIAAGAENVPSEIPYRRGAGRLNALAAHTASVVLSESGLSFGLAHETAGTFEATRTVVVTNRGTSEETFTAGDLAAGTGMTITVNPATFTLAAGASQTIDVTLRVDAATAAFTDRSGRGATIPFTGSRGTTLNVGWGVLRAARLTVRYADGGIASAVAYSDDDLDGADPFDDGLAEGLFSPPGKKWDLLVSAYDENASRLVAYEQLAISGDMLLEVKASDAPLRLMLDGRDEHGVPLRELPRVETRRQHHLGMRLIHPYGKRPFTIAYELGNAKELWLSPMTRFRLIPFESYVDLDNRRVYTVQHDEFSSAATTLSRDASSYVRGSVTWRRSSDAETEIYVCGLTAFKPDYLYWWTGLNCVNEPLADELTIEYFSTEEKNRDGSCALVMQSNTVALPLVRAIGGELVISSEVSVPESALRIPNGGRQTVGIGPRHPWAFFGTNLHLNQNGYGFGYPAWGYNGAAGEIRHDVEPGTYWWYFDAEGKGVKHGDLTDTWFQKLKLEPGHRFVARNDTFRVAGHPSRGELEMRYGPATHDRTPPTLTSLRILDAQNRSVDRVANGEAATLHLAYADLHDLGGGLPRTMPFNADGLRVSYRVTGSLDWKPLARAVLVKSETGSLSTLLHMPTGETWRFDLSEVTKHANTLIDLRIELVDASANQTVWTQSPVLMVGEVRSGPKRRSAR